MNINEVMRTVFGILCLVTGGLVIILIILDDILMTVATLSIALGLLSVFVVYDARVEREKKLQEEIRRKLSMIRLENESNLKLLERLKERMKKLYPPELEKKKLKQGKLKHWLFPEDIQKIKEGGLWIDKQHCLYHSALQVVEIGHHFEDRTFIETIKEYIEKLDDLNQQKDFIQMWIISRGIKLNVDEMHGLRILINEADKISKTLRDKIEAVIKQIKELKS